MNDRRQFYLPQLFVFLLVVLVAPLARAQQISLSGPVLTVQEGEDAFSQFGNPRDMNSPCDVPRDDWFYAPKSTGGGIWSATNPHRAGPAIYLLPLPLPGTLIPHYEDCGPVGVRNTIDANRYTQLVWRSRNSGPFRIGVQWSFNDWLPINHMIAADGVQITPGPPLVAIQRPTQPNQWSINSVDLGRPATVGDDWQGRVTALALNPSIDLPAGSLTEFDWVRLVDPSSGANIQLSWSTPNETARHIVLLYLDDQPSGYGGTPLFASPDANDSFVFQTAMLPPGVHYIYAELIDFIPGASTLISRSNYIGPITVNEAPRVHITAPSRTSGADYARDELGDPWDMNQASDVVNFVDANGVALDTVFNGMTPYSWEFSNGLLHTTSLQSAPGSNSVDTQVHFRVDPARPINPQRYRYFCYRMQVDNRHIPRNGDAALLNLAGWVARAVWVQRDAVPGLGSTLAHELLETTTQFPDLVHGFHTYCLDMWDDTGLEFGPTWRSLSKITTMRLDPVEATPATQVIIDHAAVYAENLPDANGVYELRWSLEDRDSARVDLEFYYDVDQVGFNGNLIARLDGQGPGAGSYQWNTAGVPSGRYYIYVVARDGLNVRRYYSDVEVVLNGQVALSPSVAAKRAPADVNGDGRSDFIVVRPGKSKQWFIRDSATALVQVRDWGRPSSDRAYDFDRDGDRRSDLTLVRTEANGGLSWFAEQVLSSFAFWGAAGDLPLAVDFDGDGRDDTAVFRLADASWWAILSGGGVLAANWGLAGDLPVAADFDGDSRDDLAVYRPSEGRWLIVPSSGSIGTQNETVLDRQFGLPGDHPLPGDYDGDGVADLAVWRPASGHWFICRSSSGFDCTAVVPQQFGLPGDIPVQADYDGDGKLDLAVWRPSNGYWFILQSSSNQIHLQQWGLPGDMPLNRGVLDQLR